MSEVRTFRREIKQREAELSKARARQERVVAERAARKAGSRRSCSSGSSSSPPSRARSRSSRPRSAARQLASRRRPARACRGAAGGTAAAATRLRRRAHERRARPGPAAGEVRRRRRDRDAVPRHPVPVGRVVAPAASTAPGSSTYVFSPDRRLAAALGSQYGVGVGRLPLRARRRATSSSSDGLGHVGIYIGGGQFIHSPHTGDVVKISSLTGYYASAWYGARRVLLSPPARGNTPGRGLLASRTSPMPLVGRS